MTSPTTVSTISAMLPARLTWSLSSTSGRSRGLHSSSLSSNFKPGANHWMRAKTKTMLPKALIIPPRYCARDSINVSITFPALRSVWLRLIPSPTSASALRTAKTMRSTIQNVGKSCGPTR